MGDDLTRRDEDRKWRESVESRVVSLTASQKVTDDELDELNLTVQEIKETLNGDIRAREGGLIEQFHALQSQLNSVLRVLHPDSLGHGGLLNEFRDIKGIVTGKSEDKQYRWQFLNSSLTAIVSVVVALITSAALVITNWDKVAAFFERQSRLGPLEQKIERAKRPRGKKVTRARVVPAPEPTEANEVPE